MTVDLKPLAGKSRLLFAIPLRPLQGQRFQPTGFPNLGAASFRSSQGECLLVESAQSMANRLEMTIWDNASQRPVADLEGISHVRVERQGTFLTDSILEAHRINSPYLLEGKDRSLFDAIKAAVGAMEAGPVDRRKLASTLLRYDLGSLLHGAFLAKKDLAGGRLRVARALSAFIEAEGVRIAASGGVKNDAVNPGGDTSKGFGNVPFSRDEYTADRITLYVNLDLAQIRGYGLGAEAENLLVLTALYKVRSLIGGDLRLRTACDLCAQDEAIAATNVAGYLLPTMEDLAGATRHAVAACRGAMEVTTVKFEDKLESAKDRKAAKDGAEESETEGEA